MSLTDWASQVAQDKLESLPSRWAHVKGVARKARTLRAIAGHDADLLEAAAVLHDVGYAPDIAVTGFHPLDGALYLADVGAPERLVHLIAHHSYALLEAELRGLSGEMTKFYDEQGPIRDALWYCDQTTSPFGEPVLHRDRIAEIRHRYGPGHLVTRFITQAEPELTAAVERTEQRLTALAQPHDRRGQLRHRAHLIDDDLLARGGVSLEGTQAEVIDHAGNARNSGTISAASATSS